ncbi:MAG: hypothetical protein CMH54_09085 [Myxococcales bacterium]|nr:hypothetical protein [Myxococcales bacterium]
MKLFARTRLLMGLLALSFLFSGCVFYISVPKANRSYHKTIKKAKRITAEVDQDTDAIVRAIRTWVRKTGKKPAVLAKIRIHIQGMRAAHTDMAALIPRMVDNHRRFKKLTRGHRKIKDKDPKYRPAKTIHRNMNKLLRSFTNAGQDYKRHRKQVRRHAERLRIRYRRPRH